MTRTSTYFCDEKTSSRMRSVRSSNTSIEKRIGRILVENGIKFRTNCSDLPGCPDFAFHRRRKIIFAHGCFWHRHRGCCRATTPRQNASLWKEKFEKTVRRDRRNLRLLKAAGWKILVLWECMLRDDVTLRAAIAQFLRPDQSVSQRPATEAETTRRRVSREN